MKFHSSATLQFKYTKLMLFLLALVNAFSLITLVYFDFVTIDSWQDLGIAVAVMTASQIVFPILTVIFTIVAFHTVSAFTNNADFIINPLTPLGALGIFAVYFGGAVGLLLLSYVSTIEIHSFVATAVASYISIVIGLFAD